MANVGSQSVVIRILAGLLLITVLLTADAIGDWMGWYSTLHMLVELASMLVLAAMIAYLIHLLWQAQTREQVLRDNASQNRQQIEALHEELGHWRHENRELIDGIHQQINRQFARWDLSEAEQDIARWLLQGESLKRIAGKRHTSEATVRQQASEIYRKSGLAGRSELAAWFIKRFF